MLEEKLDLLTKEIVALRKAVEENTAAGGATSSAAAPAAEKKTRGRPKAEPVEPEHSKDEVESKVREVSKTVGRDSAIALIQSFKCDDLADLLTHPEHYDAAYAKAEEALAAGNEEEPEDDI
jgi:hypothetical protein